MAFSICTINLDRTIGKQIQKVARKAPPRLGLPENGVILI
jgi:hypothetical protein